MISDGPTPSTYPRYFPSCTCPFSQRMLGAIASPFLTHTMIFGFGHDTLRIKKALARITPVSGPAEAAGTAVTFYGRGFVNTTELACRFAFAPPVPAKFVSPNELVCESPPLFSAVNSAVDEYGGSDDDVSARGLRWSSLSEIWQRDSDPLTGSRQLFPGAHYHPLFSQRAVGVEVCRVAPVARTRYISIACFCIRCCRWRHRIDILSHECFYSVWYTISSHENNEEHSFYPSGSSTHRSVVRIFPRKNY